MTQTAPFEIMTVGEATYNLKISMARAAKLEKELKTDLLSGMEKLGEINVLAMYYFAAMEGMNDSIKTIDDVYTFFDDYVLLEDGNIQNLQEKMLDVLIISGIMTKEVREATKKAVEKQKAALQKLLD